MLENDKFADLPKENDRPGDAADDGGEKTSPGTAATSGDDAAPGPQIEIDSTVGPSVVGEPTTLAPVRPSHSGFLKKIFLGTNGLRAGWRLIIYVCLLSALSAVIRVIMVRLFGTTGMPPGDMRPSRMLVGRIITLVIAGTAALIMARIERERWGHYGLPLRRAVSHDFWFGCLWGFAGLSFVMGVLWKAGAYHMDGLAITGALAWKYAALWGLVFLMVGVFEEFLLRGYLLYTLASGIGFWPASILTSSLFLLGHLKNPGENWFGLADVFVIGMFFCLTLWRTGDLWFAVGLHAAWDWGQSYFYSVPDSGMVAPGHLFKMHMQGPSWLSGGSVGPEGSAVSLITHVLFFAVFMLIYRRRKWVGMQPVVSRRLSVGSEGEANHAAR
jgi:uncharacterized protein